jgi:hypothetical protein
VDLVTLRDATAHLNLKPTELEQVRRLLQGKAVRRVGHSNLYHRADVLAVVREALREPPKKPDPPSLPLRKRKD